MTSWTSPDFLTRVWNARTIAQIDALLRQLPLADPNESQWDIEEKRIRGWRKGRFHWVPVGGDRGNGGRIKLAGEPTNPIAERLVNGMEAILELERIRELAKNPSAPVPNTPREAVQRYFGLPPLDTVPRLDPNERKTIQEYINTVRRKLTVHLTFDRIVRDFAVVVRDGGMGQTPARIHKTLLSLGQTDKADKPYMIGVFGQGGSSTYAASEYSVIISRRAPDILGKGEDGGAGWSVVRQIHPKGRRDPYFAYLAASEDGAVSGFDAKVADKVGFAHGSHFCHIKYDFGSSGSAVARVLYQALNHVLFNPILPYDLFTIDKESPELMQGTSQRLARKVSQLGRQSTLDKSFASQPVG